MSFASLKIMLCVLLVSSSAYAAETIVESSPTDSLSKVLNIQIAEQPTLLLPTQNYFYYTGDSETTPDAVLKGTWLNAGTDGYRPKSSATEYWIKFTAKNSSLLADQFVVYHASNFIIEKMAVYGIQQDIPVLLGVTGTQIPFENRTLKHRINAAKVTITRGQTAAFLIHVHTTRPFKPDFAISSVDSFGEHIQSRNLIYGFCVGIQCIVILISTLFAWRLRDRAYAWFSVLSFAMILMVLVGYGFKDASGISSLDAFDSSVMIRVLRPAVTYLVLHLTAVFLSIQTRTPRLFQWFQATKFSLMTLVVLSFIPSVARHAISGADRLIFLGIILTIMASFRAWRMAVPLAGYFLVATSSLVLSIVPWLLVQTTGNAVPAYALDLIPIGQSVEMAVLITALMAKVRRLDEARATAEVEAGKNEELKSLVRVLSHDLNNPLSLIMAYAHKGQAAMQESGNVEIARYFEKIKKSSENQLAIIDHIKTMRAVQDGKSDLQLTHVSLLDVLKQAESTFEQKLQDKQLKLVYDHSALKSLNVVAEAVSLNHNVLNNLISNAIKFSHPGSSIDISAIVSDTMISLTVEDHGVGIPKEIIANIFRTDTPTSRPGTQGERGTGFGMPVVKSYVQRFGGDIKIVSTTERESPERHGTRVTISLKKAA